MSAPIFSTFTSAVVTRPLDNFDIPQLVEATEGFSGAEIEQIVITTYYRACMNSARPIQNYW
jgi:SpoVK/Ycf46/Vps4 family AAA+-type ATPase